MTSAPIPGGAVIARTMAESTPYNPPRPYAGGRPNVIVVLLDDVGFAQLGCFGSTIRTPAMDRLGAEGLRFNRFHVTALCSPSRASLLTGRNHHAVGMGFLCDMPIGFPGYSCRIPRSAASTAQVLKDEGWNTMAVGKWHLVPRNDRSLAGPFDTWPLGMGFERFYGFLHGDANQWTPTLMRDNSSTEPPRSPEEGYHLSEDLADEAIRMIRDQKHAAPEKPFYLYFAPGTAHAPHQVRPEWSDPYRGAFDQGWEAWREEVFARQLELGVVPEGTRLPERPPWIQDWAALPAEERRLFARFQEVFAGFMTHFDAQLGRLLDGLDELGIADDTMVILTSDNGASAEGGTIGSINEHRFGFGAPESLAENLAGIDELGGYRSYNHYPWGWAWAGNTPFRLWKRYTWLGGVRTPFVVRPPKGVVPDPGAVRTQFAHIIDLHPTILDLCGVPAPLSVAGVEQQPVDGMSLLPAMRDGAAPEVRTTQYFEMLGSRSIVHDGWKATTDHVSQGVPDERLLEGSRVLEDDRWSLYRLAEDFAEVDDLSAEHPDVLASLEEVWWAEAERNQVLPLEDSLIGRLAAMEPPVYPLSSRLVVRPGGSPLADEVVPSLAGGTQVTADVDVPAGGGAGVLAAMGDWSNGWALVVLDGCPALLLNTTSTPYAVRSDRPLPEGRHEVGFRFVPSADGSGSGVLSVDGQTWHAGALPAGMGASGIQIGGGGLRVGHDAGFPVSDDYQPPFPWTGTLHSVTFLSEGLPALDAARLAEALKRE